MAVSAKSVHNAIFPPESLLKKKKLAAKRREQYEAAEQKFAASQAEKKKVSFARAEKYVKEYREAEREAERLAKEAQQNDSIYVPAEAKLAFVVRVKGINKIPPKPKKVLQLLRLDRVNTGTFVRLNKATAELLRIVEPYVTYGYPNLQSVRELIYKRGHGKVNHQRVPLTDNHIIEKALGKYGIICIEDLVHEIYTVGPNFKEANNFLWQFRLSNPDGGWGVRRKFKHVVAGGSLGNREDKINELIRAQV